MNESLNQARISDIEASPQIDKYSDKIREKVSSLNLPPDLALQAEWTLNKMIQRETKGGATLKTPDKRTYSVDELLANIQTAEQVRFLIQHENERALREEVTVREDKKDANKSEKLPSWQLLDTENLENWKKGNGIPGFFNEGDYVAIANIPNMMSENNESDLYFCWGKTMPELPIGVLGEVEYYQLLKKGEPLQPVGKRQSLNESSDKLQRQILKETVKKEEEFPSDLKSTVTPEMAQDTKVIQSRSKDGEIMAGQLFIYDYPGQPLSGIDQDLFKGRVLGLNEKGYIVVESLDSKKIFTLNKSVWDELQKTNVEFIKVAGSPKELTDAYNKAKEKKEKQKEMKEKMKRIEFANNKEFIRNIFSRELDELEKRDLNNQVEKEYTFRDKENSTPKLMDLQKENLAQFIAEKIVGDIQVHEQDLKDLKELFSVILDLFLQEVYSKNKILDLIVENYEKYNPLKTN